MDINCDIIKDILPLYADSVCSEESRKLVEKHICSCSECSALLTEIKTDSLLKNLTTEANTVIEHHEKKLNRVALTAGIVLSAIMMIPVIVCFIVNLAEGHSLDWFFIVLTALMLFASMTVVPLLSAKHKFCRSFGTFTLSLLLLLAVCCIYTGGNWFFVTSSAILFGFSLIFLPFAVWCEPLKTVLKNSKGLTVLICNLVTAALMFTAIGFYIKPENMTVFRQVVTVLSVLLMVYAVFFVILRYVRGKTTAKIGLCLGISGILFYFSPNILGLILADYRLPLVKSNFNDWTNYSYENTCVILLAAGIILSVASITALVFRKGKKK